MSLSVIIGRLRVSNMIGADCGRHWLKFIKLGEKKIDKKASTPKQRRGDRLVGLSGP